MKVMPYGPHKDDVWINVCITVFLGNVGANDSTVAAIQRSTVIG